MVEGRQVVAAFDGGEGPTDARGLLLGATDRTIHLVRRFAGCLVDDRAPTQVEHTVTAIVAQRVFAVALGYEDLIDHDHLRDDPVLETFAGKSTLTGSSPRPCCRPAIAAPPSERPVYRRLRPVPRAGAARPKSVHQRPRTTILG